MCPDGVANGTKDSWSDESIVDTLHTRTGAVCTGGANGIACPVPVGVEASMLIVDWLSPLSMNQAQSSPIELSQA